MKYTVQLHNRSKTECCLFLDIGKTVKVVMSPKLTAGNYRTLVSWTLETLQGYLFLKLDQLNTKTDQ